MALAPNRKGINSKDVDTNGHIKSRSLLQIKTSDVTCENSSHRFYIPNATKENICIVAVQNNDGLITSVGCDNSGWYFYISNAQQNDIHTFTYYYFNL